MRIRLFIACSLAAAVALPVVAEARSSAPSAGAKLEHNIEMDDFAFRPARFVTRPGRLVVWKNSDRAPHNATALRVVSGKPAFRTRTGNKDARLTARAPSRKGAYVYVCSIHPRMRGSLIVR